MVWVPRETKVLVLRDPESVDLDVAENVRPRKGLHREYSTRFLSPFAKHSREATAESRNLVR